MEILIVILCLIIVGLIITILVMSDKIDDIRNRKSFYEDLYHQYKDDCNVLGKKVDEYQKIFENIKSLMPF